MTSSTPCVGEITLEEIVSRRRMRRIVQTRPYRLYSKAREEHVRTIVVIVISLERLERSEAVERLERLELASFLSSLIQHLALIQPRWCWSV
jgi:hypothetical protein